MIDSERSCYFCIHNSICCIFNPILALLAEHPCIITNNYSHSRSCGYEDTPALSEEVFDALASACTKYQVKKERGQ